MTTYIPTYNVPSPPGSIIHTGVSLRMVYVELMCFEFPIQQVHTSLLLQVSVEGNIGCGKTTLLDYFQSMTTVHVCSNMLESFN